MALTGREKLPPGPMRVTWDIPYKASHTQRWSTASKRPDIMLISAANARQRWRRGHLSLESSFLGILHKRLALPKV
jgi:hypothetical protein